MVTSRAKCTFRAFTLCAGPEPPALGVQCYLWKSTGVDCPLWVVKAVRDTREECLCMSPVPWFLLKMSPYCSTYCAFLSACEAHVEEFWG